MSALKIHSYTTEPVLEYVQNHAEHKICVGSCYNIDIQGAARRGGGGGGGGALNKTIGSNLNNEAQVLYRHCQQLSLTTTRTQYRGGSFLPRTIRDWNSLQECSRGDDCWHFCVTRLPLTSQLGFFVLEKELETVQQFKELWPELKCGLFCFVFANTQSAGIIINMIVGI